LLPGEDGDRPEALRQGLQELGYVEGRTAVIEWRWWEGKPERLRDAVAEMVRLNLDVIVVGGSEATKAMKEATRSIPIVFAGPAIRSRKDWCGVSRGRAATSRVSRWHSPTP
jgi:ABC-type uncharacterized transport system substrate-binding protein